MGNMVVFGIVIDNLDFNLEIKFIIVNFLFFIGVKIGNIDLL